MSTRTSDPSASSSARTTACATGSAQRVTALLMALFTIAVVVQVLLPGAIGYDKLGRHLLARSG